jgi:hypothetical protein
MIHNRPVERAPGRSRIGVRDDGLRNFSGRQRSIRFIPPFALSTIMASDDRSADALKSTVRAKYAALATDDDS